MFHYLDRYYLKNGAEKSMTLTETALSIWKKQIFDMFQKDLNLSIQAEIKKDRDNEIVDKELIKKSI